MKLLLTLASSLALCLLFACGQKAGAAGDGKLRIAVIPKGTTHEFWKAVHAGAEQAAQELDVEVIWKGPLQEDDRDAQIKVVEDFIIRGVDAIVLMPLDDRALVGPARDAVGQGIPVVIADSGLDWDGSVSFVATDNYEGGRMGGRKLGELLGGRGKVVLIRYVEGSASTMKREQGFLDVLREEFPEIELLSENQRAGASLDGAYQTAENVLNSFPDLDGVFCPNESSVFGMLRALEDVGKAGEVAFVGFDSSPKLLEGLRKDHIDALVLQSPVAMGERAVRAAVEHLRGVEVPKRIDTGVTIATGENIDDAEIAALLSPDLSILGE